jgi:hypothetical protein
MSLLSLAPDIQEEILFLSRRQKGRDPILLRHLLPIAAVADWKKQRARWKALTAWRIDPAFCPPQHIWASKNLS